MTALDLVPPAEPSSCALPIPTTRGVGTIVSLAPPVPIRALTTGTTMVLLGARNKSRLTLLGILACSS